MTHDELITLIRQPESVASGHVIDLKELVDRFPYFAPTQLLYAKALQQSSSVLFSSNLKIASLFVPDRRWLYSYIYPHKKISTEPYRREKISKSSGDYFDMINKLESAGGDTKKSLSNLAQKLKSAREMVVSNTPHQDKEIKEVEKVKETNEVKVVVEIKDAKPISEDYYSLVEPDYSESNARKLIKEHKYKDAIEILRALNLNNPKKSVYFADQIRFLEKVIANSKK